MHALIISDRRNLDKFAEKINFTIKRKEKALNKLLKSYKLFVYQNNEVERIILNSLKTSPKTVKELSKTLHRSNRTTHYHLQRLKKKNKLKPIIRWRILSGNAPNLWKISR